jgi:ectoine hydroxylase-related dioxygenase (phytanoyl-CoA dioxygenase family)
VERGVVPWHQDSGYFEPHCDDNLIVTVWIPLVDATPENGCLQVMPRAHREGVFRHWANGPGGFLIIDDEDLPPAQRPVTVPVPLGGALFMSNCTPHCSTPNNTDVVRWSLDLRYQSADVPNNVGEMPQDFHRERPTYEIACYPPEADFVVQSEKAPERVVDSPEAFDALRQRYEETRPQSPQRGWTSYDSAGK